MHWRAGRLLAGLAVPALVASGCASKSPRAAHPIPPAPPARPGTAPLPLPAPELRDGYAIARTALALQGIPYRLGGSDTRGFDCSGLVQYVFALHGLGLPRVVRDQYRYGTPVDLDRLEPGDLVFFETQGSDVSHVGIAIGGDQFVHAPNARGVVRTSRLTAGYWGERAVGARRMLAPLTDSR